jgi:uncharacterized protein (DUF2384 family)
MTKRMRSAKPAESRSKTGTKKTRAKASSAFGSTRTLYQAREAQKIVRDLKAAGLSSNDIARATGASEHTIRSWSRATRAPRPGLRRNRLLELKSIVDRLDLLGMKQERIPLWLATPNPSLNDRKPLELVRSGRYLPVSRVIAEIESPGAV